MDPVSGFVSLSSPSFSPGISFVAYLLAPLRIPGESIAVKITEV